MSSLRFKQVDVFTSQIKFSDSWRPWAQQETIRPHHYVLIVGVVWLIVDLGDARAVAGLNPDLGSLGKISAETHAADVTIFGQMKDGPARLHVRSFAPALGVPEDPVCGSGNASVAAYLIHTGLISGIGTDYTARQGMNVGRDGLVAVKVAGDEISIGGYAVTCVDGTLCVA